MCIDHENGKESSRRKRGFEEVEKWAIRHTQHESRKESIGRGGRVEKDFRILEEKLRVENQHKHFFFNAKRHLILCVLI